MSSKPTTGRFGDDLENRLPDAFTNALGILEHKGYDDVASRLESVAKGWFAELKAFRAAPALLSSGGPQEAWDDEIENLKDLISKFDSLAEQNKIPSKAAHQDLRRQAAGLPFAQVAAHLRTILAAAPVSTSLGGTNQIDSLSAYADLAAEHDDALPLTATVEEGGLIQLHMRNGFPVEATPEFAQFVTDACNAAGAGFLADLRAENAKEGVSTSLGGGAAEEAPTARTIDIGAGQTLTVDSLIKKLEIARHFAEKDEDDRVAYNRLNGSIAYCTQVLRMILSPAALALPFRSGSKEIRDKKRARDLHYALIDMGLPDRGSENATARALIENAFAEAADHLLVDSSGAGQWVPVGERLPVPQRKVLILLKPGERHGHDAIEIGYFVDYGDAAEMAPGHWSSWESIPFADVIGWQELPFALL